jgi:hypothetical protein
LSRWGNQTRVWTNEKDFYIKFNFNDFRNVFFESKFDEDENKLLKKEYYILWNDKLSDDWTLIVDLYERHFPVNKEDFKYEPNIINDWQIKNGKLYVKNNKSNKYEEFLSIKIVDEKSIIIENLQNKKKYELSTDYYDNSY